MLHPSKTAIIYFARSAGEDYKRNRFSERDVHGRLIDRLSRHTLSTIRATGLTILLSNEANQEGENLAERLAHAFSEAFAKGYQNVIAVGNDTPDLDAKTLIQAANELADGNPVLGPSLDGGNYLIGIREKDFKETAFCRALKVPGETHARLGSLLGKYEELPTLIDVDDEKSLKRWLRSFSSDSKKTLFRKEIKGILAVPSTGRNYTPAINLRLSEFKISDRAPPLRLAS
ncbi:DUF2064 domain-containing protein [Cryomorphaceae bacterium 1068]|nr:DUF2064 domain-containing protein [Cryomorphaceae bacterium 1068]